MPKKTFLTHFVEWETSKSTRTLKNPPAGLFFLGQQRGERDGKSTSLKMSVKRFYQFSRASILMAGLISVE